jgi:hypothetical protein
MKFAATIFSAKNRVNEKLKLGGEKVEIVQLSRSATLTEALALQGIESGASDGARTRDLRRDRPAL